MVVKKTYLKIILREIKGSFGRFAAIFGIVTLGVGVLSGLVTTTPNMHLSVNEYYDGYKMADIFIKADMGLTEDDLSILSQSDHIENIRPAYVMDSLVNTQDNEVIPARIYGVNFLDNIDIDYGINKLELIEGRLPEKINEAVIERSGPFLNQYPIGSKISISEENDDFDDILDTYKLLEFEIVGVVSNPFHFSKEREMTSIGNGTLATIVYVDESSFSLDIFTDFFIRVNGVEHLDTFTDEYEERIENIVEEFEELGLDRSLVRYNEVLAEAREELEDGKKEYEEGKEEAEIELADALKELQDGEVELSDGLKELLDGEKELADAKETLIKEVADAEVEIADGKEKLADALIELEDGKIEIADAEKELNDGENKYIDGYLEYLDGKSELEDGQKEFDKGEAEYLDAVQELEDGKRELARGERELEDGRKELEDGERELARGERELEDGKSQLEDGMLPFISQIGYSSIDDFFRAAERDATGQVRGSLDGVILAMRAQIQDIIEGLESQKESLKTAISGIELAIQGLEAGINGLSYQIGLKESEINQIESEIESIEAQIRGLDPDDANNDEEIERLNSELESLKNEKEALEIKIDGLMVEFDSLDYSIKELENQVAYFKSQLQQTGGLGSQSVMTSSYQLDDYQLRIDDLKNDLEFFKSLIPQIEAGISEAKESLQLIPADSSIFFAGWEEIKSGELELREGRRELEDGWDQYYDGIEEIGKAKREIRDGERELEKARVEIEDAGKELEDGWKELEEGRIELSDARKKLDDGWKELADGRHDLEEGWKEYYDGLEEIADAERTLKEEVEKANDEIREADIDIAQGWKDYEEGRIELSDGEKEYLDAVLEVEQELADALKDIQEAEEDLADIEIPEWYVLDRSSNVSFVSYKMNSQKVADIAIVFPIFFYLIAALVSASTMTRMVEEERIQIGTLKALGFTKGIIIIKYIIYCGLASVLGSVIGLIFGFKIFPALIYNAYSSLFHLPKFYDPFSWDIALISAGISIFGVILVTVLVCYKSLKEKPSTLMLPRAPKPGKQILLENINFIWSRMSFNVKSTVRNIFRYKKNFFMTVIGVAGCSALLLTGFGLRDSISVVTERQYGAIFKYDIQIDLDEKNNYADIFEYLDKKESVDDYLSIYKKIGLSNANDEEMDVNIVVAEDIDRVSDFIGLNDRKAETTITYDRLSVIITDKISENLEIDIGDTFVLENSDTDISSDLIVTAIAENYLDNFVFIGEDLYKNEFGFDLDDNTILVNLNEIDSDMQNEFIEDVLHFEEVVNASLNSRAKATFDNLLVSIDYIVIVIILLSGALAFIVLYNLNNINISERKKELATFKVLGFHNEEVGNYVFRESAILSLVGILVGLLLGKLLHGFIIITIEDPDFMIGRTIDIRSYLISALLTIVFSAIVNMFMYKKIKNIEMVESMKAND